MDNVRPMTSEIEAFNKDLPSLTQKSDTMERQKGGNGGDGNDMDWKQSVENRLTRLDQRFDRLEDKMNDLNKNLRGEMSSNFKWMFGIYITTTGSILLTLAKGFGWL